mgnify:CR=1 FL=1
MHRLMLASFGTTLLWFAMPASAQDAAAGQRVYNQCRACHTINEGGRNGVGPNLHGIVGQKAAQREGFRYSPNMRELAEGGLAWTEENLRDWLTRPQAFLPDNAMNFGGFRNRTEDRDSVIAFLRASPAATGGDAERPAGGAP